MQGLTDVVLAFKWRIADSLPFLGALAVQPAVRLPTGAAALSANTTVWSVLLISSQKLGPVELDVNFGTFAPAYAGDYPHVATLWTVSTAGPRSRRVRLDRRSLRLPRHERPRQQRPARRASSPRPRSRCTIGSCSMPA